MNEIRYRNMMEKVRMSESCRQRILSHQPVHIRKKQLGIYRKMALSAAALICFSMIGGVCVYAYQNNILGSLLNADINQTNQQILDDYSGIISDFRSDINDFDAEITTSFGNEYFLNFVMVLTPSEGTDISEYSKYNDFNSYPLTDSRFNTIESSCEKCDDGSYYVYFKYNFKEPIADSAEFSFPVSLRNNDDYSYIDLGSVAFSADLSEKQKCVLCECDEKINVGLNAVCNMIMISPVYVRISGISNAPINDNPVITVWYNDGSSKEIDMHASNGGVHSCLDDSEHMYMWDIEFDTNTVIEPESISAVEINDCIIEIKKD